MRGMKGGSLADYKIEDVLGKRVKSFTALLKDGNYENFLFKNYTQNLATADPTKPGQYDDYIHYEYFEALFAILGALRAVENPEFAKATILERFGPQGLRLYDDIIRSGAGLGYQGNEVFNPAPFPQFDEQLIPGLNQLNFTKTYGENKQVNNSLTNAVKYLQYYLAQIKNPSAIEPAEVIDELFRNNTDFRRYVNGTTQALTKSTVSKDIGFQNEDQFNEAVRQGLEAVTRSIINKYQQIDATASGTTLVPGTVEVKDTDFADLAKYLNTADNSLGAHGKTLPIAAAVRALNTLRTTGINNNQLGFPLPADLENPQKQGLNNTYYLDEANFAKAIPTSTFTGGTKITVKAKPTPKITQPKNLKTVSLPFLYGPAFKNVATAGGPLASTDIAANVEIQSLLTSPYQGKIADKTLVENAEILQQGKVNLVNNLINSLNLLPPEALHSKARILAFLAHAIENNSDLAAATAADATAINQQILENLKGADILENRLKSIDLNQALTGDFRNAFVSGFGNVMSKYIKTDQGKLVPDPTGKALPNKASNLITNNTTNEVYKLLMNEILPDYSWYDTYFNLIEVNPTGPVSKDLDLRLAKLIKPEDYRLNLKKFKNVATLFGGQVGGVVYGFNTAILIARMTPPLTPNIKGAILGRADTSGKMIIIHFGNQPGAIPVTRDSMLEMALRVFNTPANQDVVTVWGNNINLPEQVKILTSKAGFSVDINKLFKDRVSKRIPGAPGSDLGLNPYTSKIDAQLRSHLEQEARHWRRADDGSFEHYTADGKVIPQLQGDQCPLIGIDAATCVNFIENCVLDDSKTTADVCLELTEFEFDTDLKSQQIAKAMSNMNPQTAFKILNRFRFGRTEVSEKDKPFSGFRRYKVQSVGSWINELINRRNLCLTRNLGPDCKPRTLASELGPVATDKLLNMIKNYDKYKGFFEYLDILVEWVNANPQELNREEDHPGSAQGITIEYPPVDKRFKIYKHVPREFEQTLRNVSGIVCGIQRMGHYLRSDLPGLKFQENISNVLNIPFDFQLPLNPATFTSPIPQLNYISQYGFMRGGDQYPYQIEFPTNDYTQYGYQSLSDFYNTLQRYLGAPPSSGSMKSTTGVKIQDKLEKYRDAEKKLMDAFKDFSDRVRLYQASRGQINAFGIPDEALPGVLNKHANLLQIKKDSQELLKSFSAYNQRGVYLLNVLKTLGDHIVDRITKKLDLQGIDTSNLVRPMSDDYPVAYVN